MYVCICMYVHVCFKRLDRSSCLVTGHDDIRPTASDPEITLPQLVLLHLSLSLIDETVCTPTHLHLPARHAPFHVLP